VLARDAVGRDANLIYGAEVVDHRLCAILQFTTTANRSRSSSKKKERKKHEEEKNCRLLIKERETENERSFQSLFSCSCSIFCFPSARTIGSSRLPLTCELFFDTTMNSTLLAALLCSSFLFVRFSVRLSIPKAILRD